MRKVILQEWVTLDGLAAGPNDSVAFVPASTQGDQSFGQEQSALMDEIDTIDEYRLVVCPLGLGSGRRLFPDETASMNMQLLDARSFRLGAVSLKYIVRR